MLCLVLICTGCASVPSGEQQQGVYDPYEPLNRKSYNLTDAIDRTLVEPAAVVYMEHVPEAIQRPISNFYRNLAYPNVILNSFLQGKIRQGLSDVLRFVINSTIGVGGLSDMAGHMGFPKHNEDFGQTLAVWGIGNGPYLFVPAYGPSNLRDSTDIPVSIFTDGMYYLAYILAGPVIVPLAVLRIIDKRVSLAESMKVRDESALDPYLFVREGYMQQRAYEIYDGAPPISHYDDLFIDELDDAPEPAQDAMDAVGTNVVP